MRLARKAEASERETADGVIGTGGARPRTLAVLFSRN